MNKSLIEALASLRLENPFSPLEDPAWITAFLLCVVGFVFNVWKGKEDQLKAMIRVGLAVAFIASIPLWSTLTRDLIYFFPYALIDYHTGLSNVFKQISAAVDVALSNTNADVSFFGIATQAILDMATAFMMRCVATLGSVIAIPLLFVQILLEKVILSLMPIAIALFTIPATRNLGQGYISFWVSVLLWPLGFAVTTVMAGMVFTVSNSLGQLWADLGSGGGVISNFLAPFTAGGILIGGIVATPPLMYSLCAHGGASISGPNVMSLAQSATNLARR